MSRGKRTTLFFFSRQSLAFVCFNRHLYLEIGTIYQRRV